MRINAVKPPSFQKPIVWRMKNVLSFVRLYSKFWFVLIFLLLFLGCESEEAEVQPTLPPLGITPSPIAVSAVNEQTPAAFIDLTTIFEGAYTGFINGMSWSPSAEFLAYYYSDPKIDDGRTSNLTLLDVESGETCELFNVINAASYHNSLFHWLTDRTLLLVDYNNALQRLENPCGANRSMTTLLSGEAVRSIEAVNEQQDLVVIRTSDQLWLIDLISGDMIPIESVVASNLNVVRFSPSGGLIAITEFVNQTSDASGTRIVDRTGNLIVEHNWEPMRGFGQTLGGPVWIDDQTLIIEVTLDQGPLRLTLDGEVESLLPLFGRIYNPQPSSDGFARSIPYADTLVDRESGQYAILLKDFGSEPPPVKLFTSQTQAVETLTEQNLFFSRSGDLWFYNQFEGFRFRSATAQGETFSPSERGACLQSEQAANGIVIATSATSVDIYFDESCSLARSIEVKNYIELETALDPTGQFVAIVTDGAADAERLLTVLKLGEK